MTYFLYLAFFRFYFKSENSNKKNYAKQTDLQVAIILTADWKRQFEDCFSESFICSQSGWHYICFVA